METQRSYSGKQKSVDKWSNLPRDILLHILQHHGLKPDLHRLRAVCSSWRTALSPNPEFPSHLRPCFRTPTHPLYGDRPLFLLGTRFYFLSPLPSSGVDGGAWVVKMIELEPSKWHLLNPVDDHLTLDYFHSDPPIVGKLGLNLLDCRVLELDKPMYLVHLSDCKTQPKCISYRIVDGWALNSSYKYAVLVNDKREDGLMLWRLGDKEWIDIEICHWGGVLDMAFHNGKFYVILLKERGHNCPKWKIGVIDPQNEMISMQFIDRPDFLVQNQLDKEINVKGISYELRYLKMVSSNEELYLAINGMREDYGGESWTSRMFVFLFKEEKEWVRLKNLGDRAFFLGFGPYNEVSFGIPSLKDYLPQWKPSTICWWFPDVDVEKGVEEYGEGSSRPDCPMPKGLECLNSLIFPTYDKYFHVFNIQKQVRLLLDYPNKDHKLYRGLFFPPPPWVKWHCPSLGNVDVSFTGLYIDDHEDDIIDEEEEQHAYITDEDYQHADTDDEDEQHADIANVEEQHDDTDDDDGDEEE
ncbi:probable F-box protein At1g65740 [Chenopodium quinoa]|uniref:probable F-box protein At1g65740 n=1 Tax=Chenopodium quinoa TaxID=63459 RepID=UPI000B788926|nr:probable F-box protein At1g65740 [Chenopodium quinoa]